MKDERTIRSSGTISKSSQSSDHWVQTWLVAPESLRIVAVREDFEFRRYALRIEPKDLARTSQAVDAQTAGGEPP